jgi:hypothetical protein
VERQKRRGELKEREQESDLAQRTLRKSAEVAEQKGET